MNVLRAASRQEVLDALASMGTVSISELAAALGRPADSLYYHFRLLQKAGLVRAAGTRESNGRREKLYQAVAPDLRLAYVPGPAGNGKAVTAIVDSMLRLTSREFKAAFQNKTIVEGAQRELWASRTTSWLTEQQIAELNRRITEMLRTTTSSQARDGEQLFALTVTVLRDGKEQAIHFDLTELLPVDGPLTPLVGKLSALPADVHSVTGTWNCKGSFQGGKPHESTYTAMPILDGTWLELTEHDTLPATGYDAKYLIGYEQIASGSLSSMRPPFSAAIYISVSGWIEGFLTMSSEPTANAAAPYALDRFLYSVRSPGALVIDWETNRRAENQQW